jgi:hypothetical protein
MAVFQTKSDIDFTNLPSAVSLNGVDLPIDVIIGLNGEKIIAESKILDGASVFERVSRKPFEVSFEFNIRELGKVRGYIFPNNAAYDIITNIWNIDQVITCKNTFLNKIGILDVIVKGITFSTIRGNTNLPCSLKCLEMFNSTNQTQSLIVKV